MNPSGGNLSAIPDGVFDTGLGIESNASRPRNQDNALHEENVSHLTSPPRKSVLISVQYQVRGRGRPMRYELGEDDDK
jgi:hypothetical protein